MGVMKVAASIFFCYVKLVHAMTMRLPQEEVVPSKQVLLQKLKDKEKV